MIYILGSKKLFTILNILIIGVMVFGVASACQYHHQTPVKHHKVVKHHNTPVNNTTAPPVVKNTTTPPVVNNTTPPPAVNNTTTPPPVVGTPNTIVSGTSIQTAINNAKTGDVIQVNAGTYSGFTLNKAVTIMASGVVKTGEIGVTASNSVLNGLTVTGDYPITLKSVSNVQILNCIITSVYNGISDTGTNNNITVKDNTLIGTNPTYGNNIAFEGVTSNSNIINNNLSGAQYGILFDVASTNNIISGNTIVGGNDVISDPAVGGVAIYTVDGSTNFVIVNNVVSRQRDAIALQDFGDGKVSVGFLVQGNTVTDSWNGIWMTLDDSIISNNIVTNNVNGIDIKGTANKIINNILNGNSNCDIASTGGTNTISGNTYNGKTTGGKLYYG